MLRCPVRNGPRHEKYKAGNRKGDQRKQNAANHPCHCEPYELALTDSDQLVPFCVDCAVAAVEKFTLVSGRTRDNREPQASNHSLTVGVVQANKHLYGEAQWLKRG